jgi:ferritin-like metal-binding protein YciE
MPKIASLQEILVDQLKDLYSAETQIAKALSKMAKAASSPDLKQGFQLHLSQTKEHPVRIKAICDALKEKAAGKKCIVTAGLVEEGPEAIDEDATTEAKDVMLIAAAQGLEHYEIAGYTSPISLAKALGLNSAVEILSATLSEEVATDAKLSKANESAISKTKKNEE